MKETIKLLLLLFCLQSCKAQIQENNKTENNIKKDSIMYPIVTKEFETFNNYQYENRKDKNSSVLSEFLKDGTYIEMLKSKSGNVYRETQKDSYFTLTKGYYTNNNIHGKGLYFNLSWGGFQKGIWYEFDEQGKLIKEIDYDKFYKFTFEDILKFCEREKIKISKGPVLYSTGFHTAILREYSPISNQATWTIEWLKETDTIQTIKIDGTTGQVLSRTDGHYINN
jgi:hypothetical protein